MKNKDTLDRREANLSVNNFRGQITLELGCSTPRDPEYIAGRFIYDADMVHVAIAHAGDWIQGASINKVRGMYRVLHKRRTTTLVPAQHITRDL